MSEVNMSVSTASCVPWPDEEAPTKPVADSSSKLLAFASRVDRLVELAIERLEAAPDDDAIGAALADLTQVRSLAGTVLR